MEIRTPEPETITVTVRDLDVAFDVNDVKPLTLYPADDMEIAEDGTIRVTFRERSQETVVMLGRQIRWYALRERTVKVPKHQPASDS